MAEPPRHYRPDIDGLRAVAIIGVVLAHAGFPWLSGGFTGVDVFFVISGFLITGIIHREMSQGRFSFAAFYERRARRILPALYAMLTVLMAAGALLLLPWDYAELGKAVLHAVGSVSNFHFRHVAEDYFARDSELNSALHTWSLAVEEQFYLLVPVIMVLAMKRGAGRTLKMLAVVMLVSFAASWWMVLRSRSGAFYLLPFRAWELALGGLAALSPRPAWRPCIQHFAGMAGLGMIAAAMLLYSPATLFPGPAALLPCAGAVLVILSGQAGLAGRLLSLRPMVFTGLISYSVYLWHWPLMAAWRRGVEEGANWPSWGMWLLPAASVVAGWMSWKWIETPFRSAGRFSRRWIFTASIAGAVVLAAASLVAYRTDVFYARLPAEAQRLAAYSIVKSPLEGAAAGERGQDKPAELGAPGKASIALWGDSHAGHLIGALEELCHRHQLRFVCHVRQGAPPLPLSLSAASGGSRHEETEGVFRRLESNPEIKAVILAARWAAYTEGRRAYGAGERIVKTRAQPLVPGLSFGAAGQYDVFRTALAEMVRRLRSSGKIVVIVYPVPEPAVLVPQTLAREVVQGRDPSRLTIPAAELYFERQAGVLKIFDSLPEGDGLFCVKPERVLISGGQIRLMEAPGGHVLYSDDDHLTPEGARLFMPQFEPVLEAVKRLPH